MKRKLKVLVLFDGTSPTTVDQDFSDELKTKEWKTEADVMNALETLGHTPEHLAIYDDVDLPDSEKRAIEPLGRYGLAGRGVAISLVGVYWMAGAIQREPSKAHELGGALQAVQQNSKGWLLLLTLGVALAASALFDFVEAFYHRPRLRRHAPS